MEDDNDDDTLTFTRAVTTRSGRAVRVKYFPQGLHTTSELKQSTLLRLLFSTSPPPLLPPLNNVHFFRTASHFANAFASVVWETTKMKGEIKTIRQYVLNKQDFQLPQHFGQVGFEKKTLVTLFLVTPLRGLLTTS